MPRAAARARPRGAHATNHAVARAPPPRRRPRPPRSEPPPLFSHKTACSAPSPLPPPPPAKQAPVPRAAPFRANAGKGVEFGRAGKRRDPELFTHKYTTRKTTTNITVATFPCGGRALSSAARRNRPLVSPSSPLPPILSSLSKPARTQHPTPKPQPHFSYCACLSLCLSSAYRRRPHLGEPLSPRRAHPSKGRRLVFFPAPHFFVPPQTSFLLRSTPLLLRSTAPAQQ